MPQVPGKSHYRDEGLGPLNRGLDDSHNPLLLQNGATPDCRNVDFNRESVSAHGGALKFNNQPLPHAGLLTRTSFAPLYVDTAKSVPQRGFAFIPYAAETDIGGDFASYEPSADPTTHSYHARRGRSFDRSISFSLPPEEKLYVGRTGTAAGSDAVVIANGSYDEGLEECTLLWQKGGDGLSPFSFALGIVNTADEFEFVTGASAFDRVSNYALVFMWYDAPQWGPVSPAAMRYVVGAGGANVGSNATDRYCTTALRAVIAKVFIEPGRTYHVAVSLKLDTGTAGATATEFPTAAFNQDGAFQIVVRDELGNTTRCNTLGTNLFVWKGPQDSYDYLTRYGVRFSGRDPTFLGLGMRFAPHTSLGGFIPLGFDSAPMEAGGHRMFSIGSGAKPAAFSVSHTATHNIANTFATINRQGMTNADYLQGINPYGSSDGLNPWIGLWDGATIFHQGTAGQSEALRGYWMAFFGNAGTAHVRGMRLRIKHYFENAGAFNFELFIPTAIGTWATNDQYFPIPFRWFQRPLRLSNFRTFNSPRTWSDARTLFSLSSYSLLDDQTEPDLANLIECYPLDDAGGGKLRETVAGRSGFLAPYALGQDGEGLFLSGEGEALALDFSDNPVLVHELEQMLRQGSQGFAIEVTLRIPQAYYALEDATTLIGVERIARLAPILAEWAVKGDTPGYTSTPAPLLRMGHRARFPTAYGSGPFFYPMGFNVEAAIDSDQTSTGPTPVLHAWASGTVSNYSLTADWVGRPIRLQFGIQSTGVADQYKVYLAASPKSALLPAAGDPGDAEFAYFSGGVGSFARDEGSFAVNAGADTLGQVGHGVPNDTAVKVYDNGSGLPAPLASGTEYFVVNTAANTLQLSLTVGGAVINITGAETPIGLYRSREFLATHTLHNGDVVHVVDTGAGIPSPLVAGTDYFVVQAAPGSVQLSLTLGGAAISTSGSNSPVGLERTAVIISRRDLARSIITIGGAWRPGNFTVGELNARVIVDRVVVFGAAAPGELPSVSGNIVTNRDGKLLGDRALPSRALTRADLLHPLSPTSPGVNVTDGSPLVFPADASRFYTGEPEDSLQSVKESYILIRGDGLEIWKEGTEPVEQEEFYFVPTVDSAGVSLTLSRNFNDRTQENASAAAFRVIGYTELGDDLSLKALAIGKGTPFAPGVNTPDDAVLTEPYFDNLAPVTAPWRLRVFASQIAARDIVPLWDRGQGVPRRNPVLGLWPHKGRLFAVTRGSLFEADDRWRRDGPTDSVTTSLAFLADIERQGFAFPQHADGVRFTNTSQIQLDGTNLNTSRLHFDAWVYLDGYAQLQTILWVGDPGSDPADDAGALAGTHHLHYWMRLANGFPEFAVGSTATYDGVNRPERGLFIARAAARVPLKTWTHVRFTVEGAQSGTWLGDPVYAFVNGRRASVSLNASQSGHAAGSWVQISTLASGAYMLLGVAHDSALAPERDGVYAASVLDGALLKPNRHHGYVHSLNGKLARVVISRSVLVLAFDPYALTYSTTRFLALESQSAVGHKVLDSSLNQYGLIESHPAVSLFHEMGQRDQPASFAVYDDRLFVTTGGRPAYVQVAS